MCANVCCVSSVVECSFFLSLCIVSLCSGCDGCCAFGRIYDACSLECSW